MTTFTVATWNINSLRVRLPHVLKWLADFKPDVLALQELKLPDADFPIAAINEAGYQAIVSGQKTYNGVAILSLKNMTDVVTDFPGFTDPQRRILATTIDGIRIINVYVPNGESIESTKYQYKLSWLKQLNIFLRDQLTKYPKMIVVGDFNIAPNPIDVHDPVLWEGKVLFSTLERQAFHDYLNLGLEDSFRLHHPEEKSYTWWDYRLNAFKRKMGLRIDHVLVSSAMSSLCHACEIDATQRSLERPSDHAPVIATFSC